jgi:hypothetical protein
MIIEGKQSGPRLHPLLIVVIVCCKQFVVFPVLIWLCTMGKSVSELGRLADFWWV